MPPKAATADVTGRDKDLLFIWACLQNSDFKQSQINWNAVSTALDIKKGTASMRWFRLAKSLEGAVPIALNKDEDAAGADSGASANGFTAVNAKDKDAEEGEDGEPKKKKQRKTPAKAGVAGSKRKKGKATEAEADGEAPAADEETKIKEEASNEEEDAIST